jgi:Leucine-rich repeat (LRR) protein
MNCLILRLQYCQNYGKPYSSFDGTLALFSSLTNLQYLVLNQNNFTGSIPPAFSSFKSLLYLDLSYNQLSSSVGSWIGQVPQLEWLMLAGNAISGSIPAEINMLHNLTVLDLSSNARLGGSLPSGFGLSFQTLTSLAIQYTRLSGSLPDSFCHIFSDPATWRVPTNFPPQYLRQFWYRLKIDPQFPSSFFNSHDACTSFVLFEVEVSRIDVDLCSIFAVPQFEIYLFSAKMSGTLPACLSRMKQLQNLHLNSNDLTGTIPSDLNRLDNLVFIDFSNNMLNGTIPSSLGQLQLMTDLRLMGNELSGTLPAELQNATSLRFLDVSRNFISGSVPDSWALLHKLKKLNIGYNRIQSLPQNMGEMVSLLQLIAPRNKLTTLPTSLSKLSLLTVLDVSGNLISGNLKDYLSGSMVVVDISKNRFSGILELPSPPAQSSLQLIDIQRNQYESNSCSRCLTHFVH